MADTHDSFERRRANRTIHIERRHPSPTPWILGALLVLVLAVVFWPNGDGRDRDGYVMPAVGGSVVTDADLRVLAADSAIGNFVRFVSARGQDAVGPKHEYTAEGIRRLAIAINMLAVQDTVAGGALSARIEALLGRADALQRDPNADTHALKTREAFLLAASILDSIQDRRFGDLDGEATVVLRAAEGVKVREPLTEQAAEVDRFFDQTANLLRAMQSAGP